MTGHVCNGAETKPGEVRLTGHFCRTFVDWGGLAARKSLGRVCRNLPGRVRDSTPRAPVPILALPLPSCVTLDMILNLCAFFFSPIKSKNMLLFISNYLVDERELYWAV